MHERARLHVRGEYVGASDDRNVADRLEVRPVARQDTDRSRHCHGFYGASSMERLPVERAIREQVAQFKRMKQSSQ